MLCHFANFRTHFGKDNQIFGSLDWIGSALSTFLHFCQEAKKVFEMFSEKIFSTKLGKTFSSLNLILQTRFFVVLADMQILSTSLLILIIGWRGTTPAAATTAATTGTTGTTGTTITITAATAATAAATTGATTAAATTATKKTGFCQKSAILQKVDQRKCRKKVETFCRHATRRIVTLM